MQAITFKSMKCKSKREIFHYRPHGQTCYVQKYFTYYIQLYSKCCQRLILQEQHLLRWNVAGQHTPLVIDIDNGWFSAEKTDQ